MKAHRTSRVAAGVALALSLSLTGCGAEQPDTAARYGDQVVSESDVITASRELSGVQLPQPVDPQNATVMLLVGPVLENHFRQAGVVIGEDQARSLLPDRNMQLSAPSLEVLKAMAASSLYEQAHQAAGQPGAPAAATKIAAAGEDASKELNQAMSSGKLVLNPKYARQQVDWIHQDLSQQQQPTPQH